jgi:hypothetical protein
MGMNDDMVAYRIFIICCPVRGHEHIKIGEWAGELDSIVHQGFNCPVCKKMKKFDQKSFRNYLQKGLFRSKC